MLLKSTVYNYYFTQEHDNNVPKDGINMPVEQVVIIESEDLANYLLSVIGIVEVKEVVKEEVVNVENSVNVDKEN